MDDFIDIQKLLPNIDFNKLSDVSSCTEAKPPKVETMEFLRNSLSIQEEIKYPDLFMRNYVYLTIITRKHLREIISRQAQIKKQMRKIEDTSSYAFKKLQYFYDRNQTAKEEILSFIAFGLKGYVSNIISPYHDLIDRAREDQIWLHGKAYDYAYNAQFYDPDYDFSTYVKYCDVPDIKPLELLKNIEQHIKLKAESPDDYVKEIINTVDKKNLLSSMSDRVGLNYHIRERKEIFDTLVTLFAEERYLAFITMAAIQLEGIFYDLVCIKFGAKERQGTLTEKVEKAFRNNPVLMQTLYPYFAFDIPELRNEVAHKGIVQGRELKLTAYELVLDLNCILRLTERASTDKFKCFLLIAEKLNEVDYCGEHESYMLSIAECLFSQLYLSDMFSYEYFWEVLTRPDVYDAEMDFYRPADLREDEYCLKDVVHRISELVKTEHFWSVVLSVCDDILSSERNRDRKIISFIDQLKNRFIGILDGTAKTQCCKINDKIRTIKAQFNP